MTCEVEHILRENTLISKEERVSGKLFLRRTYSVEQLLIAGLNLYGATFENFVIS